MPLLFPKKNNYTTIKLPHIMLLREAISTVPTATAVYSAKRAAHFGFNPLEKLFLFNLSNLPDVNTIYANVFNDTLIIESDFFKGCKPDAEYYLNQAIKFEFLGYTLYDIEQYTTTCTPSIRLTFKK